jgi:hypothetical protein
MLSSVARLIESLDALLRLRSRGGHRLIFSARILPFGPLLEWTSRTARVEEPHFLSGGHNYQALIMIKLELLNKKGWNR